MQTVAATARTEELVRGRMGLDEFYERLLGQGATVVDPLAERPWGQREFATADHLGNWLTFWERDRRLGLVARLA